MRQKVLIAVLVLFPLLSLGGFFYVLHVKHQHPSDIRNEAKKPLHYEDNQVQCPQCNMFLVGQKYTAQVIDTKGRTEFFDDIGCVILWLRDHKIEPKSVTIWAFSLDTRHYVDALKAHYTLTEETPMNYGFGVYEQPQKGSIGFDEMRLKMLRGENMSDPKVRQKLLSQGKEP